MAYNEPDTALHHLKMAKAYLDEAEKHGAKEKNANQFVSDAEIKSLLEAAHHLNNARAIDPNEVLWVEDPKDKTRTKIDQDFLNSKVLLMEGVAHLNAARDLSTKHRNTDGSVVRKVYKEGVGRLEQARDALEKSLNYRSYSDDALNFLAKAYLRLGDQQNCRRVLERHLEVSSDDIELHKQIKELDAGSVPGPLFRAPSFSISFPTIMSFTTIAAIGLFILAIVQHSGAPVGPGILLLLGSAAGFWLYEKFF